MAEPNLSELGVTAKNVEEVEDAIFASAEVQAKNAEAQELDSNIEKLDQQLKTLRAEEQILLKSSFSTRTNRRLGAIQEKIKVVQKKKMKLLEASEARQEIGKRANLVQSAIADDERKPDESEHEFLVRTGRITPFQGQSSYQDNQIGSSAIIRRRLKVPIQKHQSDEKDELAVGQEIEESINPTTSSSHTNSNCHVKGATTSISTDDGEYLPADWEEEDALEDDAYSNETGKRKKKRKNKFEDDVDFADDEVKEEGSEDIQEFLVEGDDWVTTDTEEVELEGGLRITSSIYDKLFDYQKTGVRTSMRDDLIELHVLLMH
eukprot:TRINITY_DN396_c0_g2_i5.p2 TRINITY_DN396_c0_g2~~TRINITY_DN396_c0_g2_i5.p2  ORF type:complete len:320 (-),score=72.35 TRINITY_DN396_c0_g2_i5:1603-2562(-)